MAMAPQPEPAYDQQVEIGMIQGEMQHIFDEQSKRGQLRHVFFLERGPNQLWYSGYDDSDDSGITLRADGHSPNVRRLPWEGLHQGYDIVPWEHVRQPIALDPFIPIPGGR